MNNPRITLESPALSLRLFNEAVDPEFLLPAASLAEFQSVSVTFNTALVLHPGGDLPAVSTRNDFGVFFVKAPYRKQLVTSVFACSPAGMARVRNRQIVTAINGIAADGLTSERAEQLRQTSETLSVKTEDDRGNAYGYSGIRRGAYASCEDAGTLEILFKE